MRVFALAHFWGGGDWLTFLLDVTQDHRHNFSPHFYWIYLFEDYPHKRLFGLLTFLPQLALLGICALRYASMDLPFCILLQTMIFVAFNKVSDRNPDVCPGSNRILNFVAVGRWILS